MSRCVIRAMVSLLILAAPRLAFADRVYVLNTANTLWVVDTAFPQQPLVTLPVTGLTPQERIRAIAFRPRDGQLYALVVEGEAPPDVARVYRVHVLTGVATRVGTTNLPMDGSGDVGFDFDPVTDQARVITAVGMNYRINPQTGALIQQDPPLAIAHRVAAIAYTHNVAGATTTTLYGIGLDAKGLVRIDGSTLTAIGTLGIDQFPAGLDIVGPGDQAYALLTKSSIPALTRINLTTGGESVVDILPSVDGQTAIDVAVLSRGAMLYGLTSNDQLLRFRSDRPDEILAEVPLVAPLVGGEALLAIDVRPTTGVLYAFSNQGRLFSVDPTTGQAALAGSIGGTWPGTTGLSFDPIAGHLWITDGTGANTRVELGPSQVERHDETPLTLNGAPATGIAGVAFMTSVLGEWSGLFGINQTDRMLVVIGGSDFSPAEGMVLPIGLVFSGNTPPSTGFAIDTGTNLGYLTQQRTFICPNPEELTANADDDPDPPDPPDPVPGPLPPPKVCRVWSLAGMDLSTGLVAWSAEGDRSAPLLKGLAVVPPGFVRLESAQSGADEHEQTLAVKVVREGGLFGPISVGYKTTNGTAHAGTDYTAISGTLVFLENETEKIITVPLLNDAIAESPIETFSLTIEAPTLGARLTTPSTMMVRIADDESPPNQNPVIAITSPTTSPTYEIGSLTFDLAGTASDDRGVTSVTWADNHGDSGTAEGTANWLISAIRVSATEPTIITVTAHDEFDAVATDTITVTRAASGLLTYVLAEGATGGFFDLDVLLANPDSPAATVTLTFLKEDGTTIADTRTLAGHSRLTVRVDDIPGMEATSASTVVTSNRQIVVERTMRWAEGAGYGAHTEKAVDGPAEQWYFAEGSQGFFSTYLLLANPNATENTATVAYLREGETPLTRTYTIAANARRTIDASEDPELINRSFGMTVTFAKPGVAERAMYFGAVPFWKAGHESAGVTRPSTTWFLAEGATGPFFETFILLSNPQSVAADVTLTFLIADGTPIAKTKTVPAQGRLTVNIEQEDAALANVAVATQVDASLPIVVERAQYWPRAFDEWYEAHNSFGVVAPGLAWGLAEGRVGGPEAYETYILLANPGTTAAMVSIEFLRTNGTTLTKTFTVPAQSRVNVATGPGGPVPELADEEFGARIDADQPIAVERAMYASPGGLTWSAGTNATATKLLVP